MISYKIFAFSFFSLILFCNCSDPKDPCEETKHYYFFVKPEEKAVLPYKGFDTLRLKHSSGAEYTFYAGAMDSLFTITAKATSPDCANNIIEHRQYYRLTAKTKNASDPVITIDLGLLRTSSTSDLYVRFKNSNFESVAYFPPYPNPNYLDSIEIEGTIYNKVLKIYHERDFTSSSYLYYNVEFGIVKIVLLNGETWERIP